LSRLHLRFRLKPVSHRFHQSQSTQIRQKSQYLERRWLGRHFHLQHLSLIHRHLRPQLRDLREPIHPFEYHWHHHHLRHSKNLHHRH
jgi:hypothetical protein